MELVWLYNLGGTSRQYIKLSRSQPESLSINKSPASITDASLTNYVHSRVSEAIFQEEEEEEEEGKKTRDISFSQVVEAVQVKWMVMDPCR